MVDVYVPGAKNNKMCYVLVITVRKRSCGKVMFSQVYVKNSVHRGEVYTPPAQADNAFG